MGKATGVDFSSKNKLKALAEEGYTAEEISSMIQVTEESVQKWIKYFGFKDSKPVEVEEEPEEEEEE